MNRQYIEIFLKNLISKSGIRFIEFYFKNLQDIDIHYIRLGEIALYYNPNKYNLSQIYAIFQAELGFEVIENKELQIVEKIKIAAIELIHYANNVNSLIRNSDYISQKLQMPYEKLTRVFSHHTNRTLENYILSLKIEKIKYLLIQNEFTVSEIAYMMNYSSVQYLSNQFKKNTGLTISEFKNSKYKNQIALEDL